VVLSTHILPEVEQTSIAVIIIDKGRIVAVDTPRTEIQVQGAAANLRRGAGPLGSYGKAQSPPGVMEVRRSPKTTVRIGFRSKANSEGTSAAPARTIVQSGWVCLELRPPV